MQSEYPLITHSQINDLPKCQVTQQEEFIRNRIKMLRTIKFNDSVKKILSAIEDLDEINLANDFIGAIFEKLMTREERRSFGQFYTPFPIVDFIVEHIGLTQKSRVLDLSCGSGAFLIKAFAKLKELSRQSICLSDVEMLSNIYGVDLKNISVELTKINLWLRSDLSIDDIHILDKTIKCGNSIVSDKKIAKNKTFDWYAEMKDVLMSGGFDAVIGNPPYVTLVKNRDFNPYESIYPKITNGSVNAATLMIGRALELLKGGGYLGFLLPKSLLRVESYKKLRKYLLKHTSILYLYDLGQMFKDVRGEQIILIVRKDRLCDVKNNRTTVTVYANENRDIISQSSHIIPQTLLGKFDSFLVFEKEEMYQLALKLTNGYGTLGAICEGEIFRGLPLSVNSDAISAKPFPSSEIILRGDSIRKFGIKYSLYVNQEALRSKYIEKIRMLRQPKIVLQNIFSSESGIIATYDTKGVLTIDTVTNVIVKYPINPRYILGLLNSKLINFFMIYVIYNGSKFTMHTDKVYISKIPIATVQSEKQKKIGDVVDEIIGLTLKLGCNNSEEHTKIYQKINRLNKNLNQEVYRSYHLSGEEITLVEDAVAKMRKTRRKGS